MPGGSAEFSVDPDVELDENADEEYDAPRWRPTLLIQMLEVSYVFN